MINRKFKENRNFTKWVWLTLASLLVGGFIVVTSELNEAIAGQIETIERIDNYLLQTFVQIRNPVLNEIGVNLTALGSGTVLVILVSVISSIALLSRRYLIAGNILATAVGSSLITFALKNYFERSRPDTSLRLVEVQGFSYPSGHSLSASAIYFTLAIIFREMFQGRRERSVFITALIGLIFAIGISRMYLGVHYFSDVLAGAMLGIAWSSFLAAVIPVQKNIL